MCSNSSSKTDSLGSKERVGTQGEYPYYLCMFMSHFPLSGGTFFKVMDNVESSFLTFVTILHLVVLKNQWGVVERAVVQ